MKRIAAFLFAVSLLVPSVLGATAVTGPLEYCPACLAAPTQEIFFEDFESSTVGQVPEGWTVGDPGEDIHVSDAVAWDGMQSVFMQGQPYSGSNINQDLSSLSLSFRVLLGPAVQGEGEL